MKKHLLFALCSFIFILLAVNTQAQTSSNLEAARTDANPVYEQFNSQCILDKVEYQKDRTIFHFRYRASSYTSIWLYSPEGEHPWFLKDEINDKKYNLIGVYNVRRNNRLTHKEVTEGYVYLNADSKKEKTYFECEVHFERLPQNVSEVDLIEGEGMEEAWNHFHCFNIQVAPLKEKAVPVVAPIQPEDIVLAPAIDLLEEAIAPIELVAAVPTTNEKPNHKTIKPSKENSTTLSDVATLSNWSVFPTPATNVLNVKQTNPQEADLALINVYGQVIWTGKTKSTSTTIDVSKFSTGAYFLQHTVAGNTTSQKVLIQ